MAETVQITLGANTTGAINAMRNFTASMAGATQGVQKLAMGLSSLGSNAASISSALGKTATSETISKWTDLGTSIAFAGKALADIGKGAASLASRVGPRFGIAGVGVGLLAWLGLEKYQQAEAEAQMAESIKNVREFNEKFQAELNKGIQARFEAGAISFESLRSYFDQGVEAFKSDPNKTTLQLVELAKQVRGGIGLREESKAKLMMNEFEIGRSGSSSDQINLLKERINLLREIKQSYPGNSGGGNASSIIQVPNADASERELKNYKELLDLSGQIEESQKRINELRSESSFFLNDLAATAAGSVTTALAGVADGITGIIMGTRTWAQAMQQTTASILNMVIQLILKFTVLYGLISILQAVFPGSGFVGKFAGFAGFPGKATGGLVGSGMYQVGEKGPEYVIDNKTLNRMGTGFFQSLQNGVVPSIASVPKGMAASGGGAGGSSPSMGVSLAVLGGPGSIQQWAQTREGHAYIVDIANEAIRDARS